MVHMNGQILNRDRQWNQFLVQLTCEQKKHLSSRVINCKKIQHPVKWATKHILETLCLFKKKEKTSISWRIFS